MPNLVCMCVHPHYFYSFVIICTTGPPFPRNWANNSRLQRKRDFHSQTQTFRLMANRLSKGLLLVLAIFKQACQVTRYSQHLMSPRNENSLHLFSKCMLYRLCATNFCILNNRLYHFQFRYFLCASLNIKLFYSRLLQRR